jgi:hypothetical protein
MRKIKLSQPQVRFLKRNEGLLVIFGWLILFLTFVVRDVIVEHLHTLTDAVSGAQASYLLRDGSIALHHEVDQLDIHIMTGDAQILKHFRDEPDRYEPTGDWESILDYDSLHLLRLETETGMEFDNVGRLIQKVPVADQRRSDFDSLFKQWDALKMSLLKPLPPLQENVKPDKTAPARLRHENIRMAAQLWLINEKLQLVAANILDDAESERTKEEQRLKIFRPISYLLFATGAFLTLISKLAGEPTATE